ncbi:MAG: tetratricopeptide repeat protein [Phycisphaerae bacterium]|jgi:pentatricopeptide repeat protein
MPDAARQRRNEAWLLLSVLVLAAALRLTALVQIREIGFFRQPMSDGRVYVERARQIVAGDWLGPAEFVHAPLYAYVLAAIGGPTGDYVWAPRLFQIVLGVATVALVYSSTRRVFGPRAAWIAGALLALYPPAIFFDLLIQKASVTLALSALVVFTSLRAARVGEETAVAESQGTPLLTGSAARWATAGAACGLLILNRQHGLAYLPLLALWAWLAPRAGTAARRAIRVASLLAAAALAVSPWVVRNRIVLHEWSVATPNFGQNFAMGNLPGATGTYLPMVRGAASGDREQAGWTRHAENALGRELAPREVSDFYLHAALAWIGEQPAAWLALTGKKLAMVLGAHELPDTEDYYLYAEHSATLRRLDHVWHFGVLAPLAALGVAATARAWRGLWPLYAWLVVTAVSVAAFVVFARYRLPLLPVLLAFAGAGVARMFGADEARVGRRRLVRNGAGLLAPLAIAVVVAMAANWPALSRRAPNEISYWNHGLALAEGGRLEAAVTELGRARSLAPANVEILESLGGVLAEMGRWEAALDCYQQARDGDPGYAAAWRGLGEAQFALGRTEAAVASHKQAVAIDPRDPRSQNSLASTYARLGRFDEALAMFDRLLAANPRFAEGHLNLGNTYLALGRSEEAAAAYERALAVHPDYADALFNLGVLEMNRASPAQAAEHFRRVLDVKPDHATAPAALVEALVASGRRDDAAKALAELLRRHPQRSDLEELRKRLDGRP